ncbi:MAG TPA: hypothetical protein VHF06_29520 [Pseudonocardiaceae bacterium]|nr:hypothetical protein [Pseudonocardiaceae bacterium]
MSTPIRPALLWGRCLAVVGAALLGIVAVLVVGWSTAIWLQVLVVLALYAVGIAINGGRTDDDHPVTRALGAPVKVGIGASLTFLGAYLTGPVILSVVDPESPPPATVILLLIYGFPLLALVRFLSRRMSVGLVGTAVVVAVLLTLGMAATGGTASVVAVVNLVLALAALVAVLVLPRDWPWSEGVVVFGGMAASFAVGAGTAAIGSLTAPTDSSADGTGAAGGTLPATSQTVVLVLGLLVAVALVLLAVARRQLAGGLIAGSVLAVPPAAVLLDPYYYRHGSAEIVIVVLPAVAVLLAAVALFVPVTRRWARLALPPHLRPARPVVGSSALWAMIGVGTVVTAQGVAQLGRQASGSPQQIAVVTALMIIAAGVLAWYLPARPGVLLSAVVLVGLQLNQPWWRVSSAWLYGRTVSDMRVVAVIGLVVTAGATVALVMRHRTPAVFAAGAFALAGAIGTLIAAIGEPAYLDSFLGSADIVVIAWLFGPLVLLGIPAAVAAFRSVTGQAVGAVLLASGGFALALMLLPRLTNEFSYAGLTPLIPTAPTGLMRIAPASVPTSHGFWLPALAMVVLAVALLLSTIGRPSTPLTVAGVFVLVQSTAVFVMDIAENWTDSSVTKTVVVLLIVGVVAAVVAVETLRRLRPVEPAAPLEPSAVGDVVVDHR